MEKKVVTGIMLTLLLASMLALAFNTPSFADNYSQSQAELKGSVELDFNFSPPVITKGSEYDSVEMPELPRYGAPGEPILPFKLVKALIPMGKDVQRVDVTTGNRIALKGISNLEYGKTPIPISSNVSIEDRPDQGIYGSENPFPGVLFSQMSEQHLRGYEILLLNLYPVQYIPKTGELSYFENMTVTIDLAETDEVCPLLRDLPQDRAQVSDIVDNPSEVETYTVTSSRTKSTTLVDPLYSFDYVVITSNALRSSFLPLVNWKIQKGLNATVVLVEDILKDPNYHFDGLFGDGLGSPKFNDTQAHIRNFIKDAYQNWGTEYALLGGDDEIIPCRGVYGSSEEYNIPCDMYYGTLDGSWDKDNDTVFGEPSWHGTSGEEADFFAELYVGRATVDTAQEANNFVIKTLAYEQNPQANYLKEALMIGERLDSITEGGNGKDTVSDIIPQYATTRLYDRDRTFDRTAVVDEMNAGTHIVNHDGHANYATVMGLFTSDVDSLTNTEYFLAYSIGCYSAAFDSATSGTDEAIAEHFILNPHGAFAYIGNSRYGWYSPGSTEGPGERYDRSFFRVLSGGVRNLGKALQLSKEQEPGWLDRWTYFTLNLLGDPETEIITNIKAPTAHFETRTDLLTPPRIEGLINLRGTAKRGTTYDATFSNFQIEFGPGTKPTFWVTTGLSLTNNGQSEVINGILATWNTSQVAAGLYALRLSASDSYGLVGEDRWIVVVSSGWITEKSVYSPSNTGEYVFVPDCRSSMATDSGGNLFVANDYYNSTSGYYEIHILKSLDGGKTWSRIKRVYDSTHNLRYPSIAIDPARNDLFVAIELERTASDHDIFVYKYVDGVWSWSTVTDSVGYDDRYPSITSEYQYDLNWQYISYEYVYNDNDRDLMFAKSTDHGVTWSIKKLHGNWPDGNVHAQTRITNAEGYVYISYKWGADYNSPCEIRVDRSTDFGTTWTQYADIDGLANGCSYPSIAATHGGGRVLVAFQYAWSANDIDVWFSYSNDKGASWTKGNALFISGFENETMPAVATDGNGMTGNDIMGNFHAVCQSDNYIEYKRARYDNLQSWSQLQVVNERWIYCGLAVTTQFRNGSGEHYPCVAWIDDRGQYYGSGYTLYYSTPGADIYFVTNPSSGNLEIDAISYTAPVEFNWIAGYNHSAFVPSPQFILRHECVFKNWSDNGAQSHIITADIVDQNLTVYFDVQPITVYVDASNVNDPWEDGSLLHPFDQIQEAINWTWNGDTIQVAPGIYYEQLLVNKTVSLVGEDRETITIDGNGTGNVVEITAGNVKVTGFTIQKSGTDYPNCGIYLGEGSTGNNISYNIITNNRLGIYVAYSSNNSILGNNITNNANGIYLQSSNNNMLRNNTMINNMYNFYVDGWTLLDFINDVDASNTVDGKPIYYLISKRNMTVSPDAGYVSLVNCTDIAVRDLNVTGNMQGLLLAYTTNSTATRNNIDNNYIGIYLRGSSNNSISKNDIKDNHIGIYLIYSSNNSISGNNVTRNECGISPSWDSDCTSISQNNIANNEYGIWTHGSSNNSISENNIANNEYGVYFYLSSNNTIYHNDFINNLNQIHTLEPIEESTSIWDNGYEGNYWSDYNGTDSDGDGIGDTYLPWQGVDYYPLVNPYKGHNIAITNAWINKTIIGQGYIQKIDVDVANIGSFPQTFSVTAFANNTSIQTLTVTLAAGESTTVRFYWGTSGFAKGSYTISVQAVPVLGETDTADNTYTNGIVTVVTPGDVNADGIVDIVDVAGISAHWYPGPPIGPLGYDPNFDINNDGAVDIVDVAIVSAYWTGPPKGPLAP